MTLRDIAGWLGGSVVGRDDVDILRPAKIEEAGEGSITFLANPKYARYLATTKASAVLVSPAVDVTSAAPEGSSSPQVRMESRQRRRSASASWTQMTMSVAGWTRPFAAAIAGHRSGARGLSRR